MADGNESLFRDLIAAVAALQQSVLGIEKNLEQAVGRIEKNLERMGTEAKEEHAEANRHRERLQADVRALRTEMDLMQGEFKGVIESLAEHGRKLDDHQPHIDDLKAAKKKRKGRIGDFWLPLIVGAVAGSIASFALVAGEAVWAFLNSHFFHWGG